MEKSMLEEIGGKFVRTDQIRKADGTWQSVREYAEEVSTKPGTLRIYVNRIYQVEWNKNENGWVWLSIKRRDKEACHDWRHFQEIKNQLVGQEHEAIELYPAESRKVDTANQYHLWCGPIGFKFPIGFNERAVTGSEEAEKVGAKQRPL